VVSSPVLPRAAGEDELFVRLVPSFQCSSFVVSSAVQGLTVKRRAPQRPITPMSFNFSHMASIHREVTPHGVRVYSLCGSCGAMLNAAPRFAKSAQKRKGRPSMTGVRRSAREAACRPRRADWSVGVAVASDWFLRRRR
jgi:hypothetical protein